MRNIYINIYVGYGWDLNWFDNLIIVDVFKLPQLSGDIILSVVHQVTFLSAVSTSEEGSGKFRLSPTCSLSSVKPKPRQSQP